MGSEAFVCSRYKWEWGVAGAALSHSRNPSTVEPHGCVILSVVQRRAING